MSALRDVVWVDMRGASPEQIELEKRFMQRTAALMFTIGAGLLLAAAVVPKPDTSDRSWDLGLAAALLLWGLIIPLVRRPPFWLFKASILYSITICSVLIGAARPIGACPFFYLWPIVGCAYSFSRRMLAISIGWMTVTLGVALAFFSNDQIKLIMFVSTVSCVGTIGVLVSVLRSRGVALLGELDNVIGELERASTTDPLTGLLNRRAFGVAFEREIERAVDAGMPLSVVVFDLDHFKQLNDQLGHAGGDTALCEFSGILRDACRPGDVVARLGGEEFATVLFNADVDDAERFAHDVCRRVRSQVLGGGVRLSVSAGVATLGRGTSAPDKLLLFADKALYGAKEAGRDRVARWDDGVIVGAREHEPASPPTRSVQ